MALGDIFKSAQQREREKAKKRRKAFRQARNAIQGVKERIAALKKERDRSWGEARQYLIEGQKGAAQRSIQACRAVEVLISKYEMKRWLFEQLLARLELSRTDEEFTKALEAIGNVVNIDPEAIDDVLGEVKDKLGEQADVDKVWERFYEREVEGSQAQLVETIPSVEEMMKQLEDEVAEEIGSARPAAEQGKETSLSDQIAQARERLRKLMGEDNR